MKNILYVILHGSVYKDRLKNTLTTINWSSFVANDIKTITSSDSGYDAGFEFSDEKMDEYRELVEAQIQESKSGKSTSIIPDEEDIDIDDI